MQHNREAFTRKVRTMAGYEPRFRVVIVGGSIAGLTLAHCLLRNNIDFVVLESHVDIAPQVGASIGILPNGARILDQLGLYDDVLNEVEPLRTSFIWADSAKCITTSNSPAILHERHGYPTAFLDRQILLEILYEGLADHKSRVMVNRKVAKVEHLPGKVVVYCEDQSVYEGDVVVGADGVRSTVRRQMWNYMESRGMKQDAQEERNLMTSEYNCVFGISTATPGLTPGHAHRTFAEHYSILTIVGKEGRIFWFFFTKMDRVYSASQIPRLSQTEIDDHIAPYLHKPITSEVPLSEVNKRSIVRTFVSLEEAFYKHWCVDRYVCIGDSAHKMTPNMGQGGNSAIESAASLANSLAVLARDSAHVKIDVQDIHRCLQAWQKPRQERVDKIWLSAHELTRLEALEGPKQKLIGLYLLPYLSQYLVDKTSATIVGAAKLDCAPLPRKSLDCSMPYLNGDDHALGKTDNPWTRVLSTAPLLGCYAAARMTMGTLITRVRLFMLPLFAEGVWTTGNGEVFSLTRPIYHVPFLDNLFRPLITCFLPSISGSDPQSRIQMLSFMTDLGPIYGIWLLESYRKAHSWAELLLPIDAGMAFQLKGIGKLAPIYYALEHIRTPLAKLLPGAKHQVESETSISLLLAMFAGYYLPTVANFVAPTIESRGFYNAVWQLFPVVVPLLQIPLHFLAKHLLATEQKESKQDTRKMNMRYVRYAYGTFALVSSLSFIHARFSVPAGASFARVFLPGLRDHLEPVKSFAGGIGRFLQYDEVISMASGFIWLGLKFGELKKAGASFSGGKAIGGLVGMTCAFGPGAAFALGWGWREEMLDSLAGEDE
ncbi:hypothetical protein BDQ94DRAFT_184486 [Aspergillus welwitschiae]|uniref:FAD-binding domain-containing protein n=1 Tax=Aspergillus welwitschiae TaxID=1341132 RepID=A0A3F3PKR7_9EURO|nr:hypothetical protein BDQ94DRAFT_184486 [Aspergillus welwitschiae]RDH27530.1 hypothetical protein BDQ94DRAFT_184486 [Aspergillus welwitschiae]